MTGYPARRLFIATPVAEWDPDILVVERTGGRVAAVIVALLALLVALALAIIAALHLNG